MKLIDFSSAAELDDWMPVNDGVMGGRSTGGLEHSADGTALFAGCVSFENGGGFASTRSKPRNFDLGGRAGLTLRVRGDGRRYKLNLKTDGQLDGVLYRVTFETRPDAWQVLSFGFDEFVPTFRGRLVPTAPPMDPSRIASLGLMISDRQEGPFRLEIAWIEANG